MEGSEAPVDSVETEVLGVVVFEFIFALRGVSNESKLPRTTNETYRDMEDRRRASLQCPDFGCI